MNRWSTFTVLAALLWPSTGFAKKTEEYAHRYDQVWRAAVRLIRVDQGYPIRDRDEGIGYVLFDYKDDGRSYPGSLELIRIRQNGDDAVRVAIQIPAMPSYIERMLLDKLEKKLIDEYGDPDRRAAPDEEPDEAPSQE